MSQYAQFSVSTQSESSDRVALLGRRFINYLISLNFARGQYMTEEGLDDDQKAISRELLEVEQRRRAEQARKQAVHDKVRQEVEQQLHKRLYLAVEKRLQEQTYIRERVLMLADNGPKLMDTLFSPAASSRKIEELSHGLDWLHVGMVKMVNLPPFADPNDPKRARISNFRGAMNFVGTEDIKIIAPALTMQNWLPPAEAPFVLLRRKLWQHVMATAVVSQRLAELDGKLDPAIAFNAGIFHEMGKVVLARLYVKIFDDVRQLMLRDLRNETTSARYNALVQIEPDQQFLRDLMLQKERQVTHMLFAGFELERLPLHRIYEEFASAQSITETSGYARLLWQANTFSEFRMLHSANLASLEDGKRMFAASELNAKDILELRKVNLKKLILARDRGNANA
ncbi:HDOD domain-containing protein [Aliidiomarina maris]|uniref:HDOD domain-containing protein n=1 Tax=Aliidiomarina maris TaxID=531312 RepID=A0A327X1X0_9GAMM|nr:HDOD domain-containing protein [Aliidiomarina maris]MBA3988680.1 phosphohydrolase [Idiomarina sp.]MCL5049572.1 HDOD domain-containing protein [Bacillota bacterium]RAJ98294.1 HDOD domain-containing protein [Aliidiomarina maris]RUO24876.1 phosphohydrolase [Aliidiomarina maris]